MKRIAQEKKFGELLIQGCPLATEMPKLSPRNPR
jgi:hypothetical protein